MNREGLAWAAGFFDGEGCFLSQRHVSRLRMQRRSKLAPGTVTHVPRAGVTQVDPEVLYRLQYAVGSGKIYGPYTNGNNKKPSYQWWVYGFEKTQAVMAMLWPWLGTIKRNQAKRVLYE